MTENRMMRLLLMAAFVAVLFPLHAHGWEAPENEIELYSTLKTGFVTPHTSWAKPYAHGMLRGYYLILARSEGMETDAREAIELMERLDIKLDASYRYKYYSEHWFGGDGGERRVARLMQNPYDVHILQDLQPNKLPASDLYNAREPFLEKVRAGAGVVLIGTNDGGTFKEAEALPELPAYMAGTGAVKAMAFGKGRIVQMPARPLIPYRVGWEVEYDCWQEKLTRAVLWAAGREPQVDVQIKTEAIIDRQKLPAQAVTVSWKGATPGQTTVAVRLRRWDDQQVEIGSIKCDGAEGQAAVSMPVSRAGTYHLDAFARSSKGVEGWATADVEISAPVKVGSLELFSRQPLPPRPDPAAKKTNWQEDDEFREIYTPYAEYGDAIKGQVVPSGDTAGYALRLSLADRRGRELVRKDLPAGGKQAIEFKTEPWMPALLLVEARLLKGQDEVAYDYRYLRITNRRQSGFNFVLWDAPGSQTLGPYAYEKLADMGVTTILHSSPAPLAVSAHNMSYVPWTGGPMGNPENWPDPNYGKGHAASMLRSRPSGVLAYSLGDEGAIAGAGNGPNTDKAFHAYLKGTYGDVATLNRTWESNYASFDDIKYSDAKGADGAADGLENYACAYDKTYFRGYNFIDAAKRTRKWIRETCDDPKAGIGFEGQGKIAPQPGWGGLNQICDPELICRELDFWVPYTGIVEDFVRSLAPRSMLRSSWIGYCNDAVSFKGWYWRQIMNGSNSVFYWMWSAIGAWTGFQDPRLEAESAVQAMLDDTRIVREGLGGLLLNYTMQHDGIGVFYSYPSLFVGECGARQKTYGTHLSAYVAWHDVIRDLNMQYDFVTETTLTSGDFEAQGYKVLILPQAWAMSAKAVAAVRKFVEAGGTVIADIRPALYDGRCRQVEHGALDDLFGVQGGMADAAKSVMKIDGTIKDPWADAKVALERPDEGFDRQVAIDPTLKATTGQALGKAGDVPACIVNQAGKGRAVLLNFVLNSSFQVRWETSGLGTPAPDVDIPTDIGSFFLNLFSVSGAERAFNFSGYRQKTPFYPQTQVQRWKNGDYQIVGIFRQTSGGCGQIIFDSPQNPVSPQRKASDRPYASFPHVYDIKGGLTVGRGDWFITMIEPGSPSLFVMLPGPLPPMSIDVPKQAKRGAPIVAKVSVPEARGLHSIKFRAVMPDGSPAKFWDQSVVVGREPKTLLLPLAYNDPAGEWTLTFTDLFSKDTEQHLALTVE